jgi:hypothetical protein
MRDFEVAAKQVGVLARGVKLIFISHPCRSLLAGDLCRQEYRLQAGSYDSGVQFYRSFLV